MNFHSSHRSIIFAKISVVGIWKSFVQFGSMINLIYYNGDESEGRRDDEVTSKRNDAVLSDGQNEITEIWNHWWPEYLPLFLFLSPTTFLPNPFPYTFKFVCNFSNIIMKYHGSRLQTYNINFESFLNHIFNSKNFKL